MMTTAQLAAQLGLQPDSIRRAVCRDGSYYGLVPQKLPNGRLFWSADAVAQLKNGGAMITGYLQRVCEDYPGEEPEDM